MNLLQAIFSRKWWWVTCLVLGIVVLFIRLGVWQLNRLEQRRQANITLMAVLESPPLPLAELAEPIEPEHLKDRLVIAEGIFDFEQQIILLQQRGGNGQLGAHLVAPLVLADGQTAVLIDRGWIPDAIAESDDWSQFDEMGLQQVEGVITLSQTLSRGDGNSSPPQRKRAYRVDVAVWQTQMPYTLLPFYITQSPTPTDEASFPLRSARQIDLSEGPHLSYAIQWFLFALIGGLGYLVYVRQTIS